MRTGRNPGLAVPPLPRMGGPTPRSSQYEEVVDDDDQPAARPPPPNTAHLVLSGDGLALGMLYSVTLTPCLLSSHVCHSSCTRHELFHDWLTSSASPAPLAAGRAAR